MNNQISAKPRIALLVDNPYRDLPGLILVAWELSKSGATCYLVPMNLRNQEIWALSPDFVLLNHFRTIYEDFVRDLLAAGIRVGVLDTEGSVFSPVPQSANRALQHSKQDVLPAMEEYALSMARDSKLRHNIACYCAWSAPFAEYAIQSNWYRSEQIVVTGAPRMDFYAAQWHESLRKMSAYVDDYPEPLILLTSNFALANSRFQDPNKEIDFLVKQFSYSRSFVEQWHATQTVALQGFAGLANRLAKHFPNVTFIYRPHPFESEQAYQQLLEPLPNLHLVKEGTVDGWLLRVKSLINWGSSTAIDACLAGVPSFMTSWLPSHLPVPTVEAVSVQCATENELIAHLAVVLGNQFQVSSEMKNNIEQVVKQTFYKTDGLAHQRVASAIIAALKSSDEKPSLSLCKNMAERYRTLGGMTSVQWDNSEKYFNVAQIREITTAIQDSTTRKADKTDFLLSVQTTTQVDDYRLTGLQGRSIALWAEIVNQAKTIVKPNRREVSVDDTDRGQKMTFEHPAQANITLSKEDSSNLVRFLNNLAALRVPVHIDHFKDIHQIALSKNWAERNLEHLMLMMYYPIIGQKGQRFELKSREFKIYSQNGEDGLLLYIFSKIGVKNGTFVNFGGGGSSTIANFAINFGWRGLTIDGSAENIQQDKQFFVGKLGPNLKNLVFSQSWITRENVNQTIRASEITGEIDLLSIDLDGNDYWIWEAIEVIDPGVVLIEYNASFGPARSMTVQYDPKFDIGVKHPSRWYHGASLTALAALGKQKGYALIGCESNGVNAFFVKTELIEDKFIEVTPVEAFYSHFQRINKMSDEDQFNVIRDLDYAEISLSGTYSALKQGQIHYSNQQYEKALTCFETAIEANPNDAEAWVGVAMVAQLFDDEATFQAAVRQAWTLGSSSNLQLDLRQAGVQLPFWFNKRDTVLNWLQTWRFATSSVSNAMSHKHESVQNADMLHHVQFTSGLQLAFAVDQWHDMQGFVNTCQDYIKHLPVELTQNDVVIDIGAHVGTFCIPLVRHYSGVKIFAYEPDPVNFGLLKLNRDINTIKEDRLIIKRQAVYGHAGDYEFSIGPTSTTGTMRQVGYVKNKSILPKAAIGVKTTTLDRIFDSNNIQHCKLLKVDCEGSEYDLFATVSNRNLKKVRHIIVEAHPIEGENPLNLRSILEERGYVVDSQPHKNGCWEFYCSRRDG